MNDLTRGTTGIDDDRLEDAPPSTRLAYVALREDGPATRVELADRTGMAWETVRDATHDLARRGVAERVPAPETQCACVYSVAEPE